jgi:hypothetical protein
MSRGRRADFAPELHAEIRDVPHVRHARELRERDIAVHVPLHVGERRLHLVRVGQERPLRGFAGQRHDPEPLLDQDKKDVEVSEHDPALVRQRRGESAHDGAEDTLELSGLKTGHTYELELFDGSSFVSGTTNLQNGSASGTLDYGPGDTASGAYFTTETFVAGPSQSETVTYSPVSNNYLIVNAVDLRDLGVVPEPSTYAMLLCGLGVLGFRVRRSYSSQS